MRLLLFFIATLTCIHAQKIRYIMLSKLFPHATQASVTNLVNGLNTDKTLAAQKTRMKNWIGKNWGKVTTPTFSLFDDKEWSTYKANEFLEHRTALKQFLNNYLPTHLKKNSYLTQAIITKIVAIFWTLDQRQYVGTWYDPWKDFPSFAKLVITDKTKKNNFPAKYNNATDLLFKDNYGMYRSVFGWLFYDQGFLMDRRGRKPQDPSQSGPIVVG